MDINKVIEKEIEEDYNNGRQWHAIFLKWVQFHIKKEAATQNRLSKDGCDLAATLHDGREGEK